MVDILKLMIFLENVDAYLSNNKLYQLVSELLKCIGITRSNDTSA